MPDSEATLRRGQLTALAPLRTLRAGGHGIAHVLTTKIHTTEARVELGRRAWVASIDGDTQGELGTGTSESPTPTPPNPDCSGSRGTCWSERCSSRRSF